MASIATRVAFGKAIEKIGKINPAVVVLDADLSKSTRSDFFAKSFPERFFEMGIAEANMIGTAAGLALSGRIPFICSFGCFVTGRYDQIRISIGYNRANVKIIGSHAGIGIGEDGHSQMGLEDMSVMRSVPNMLVIQPADDLETEQAVQFLANYQGPAYLRLTRQAVPRINADSYQFEMGKGVILTEGTDLAICATGGLVHLSLQAAQLLKEQGISAMVVNFHTLKPIDTELLKFLAKKVGRIMTLEDHYIIGGLGSAVCESLSQNIPAKVKVIGIPEFGESGTPASLYEKYGFTPAGICRSALAFCREGE